MLQVDCISSWEKFFSAVQSKIHGDDLQANVFDPILWPACFKKYIITITIGLILIGHFYLKLDNLLIRIYYHNIFQDQL